MGEKLYIKTRDPGNKDKIINGELVKVVHKDENPNIYRLSDGTTIFVHLDLDSVSLPINPETGKYIQSKNGDNIYNCDYHVRIVVSKPVNE
jgi:phosphotransferase system IIA component